MSERLRALEKGLGAQASELFIESQQSIAVDRPDGRRRLSGLLEKIEPVLVIYETLDTVTSGNFDENHASDVNELFRMLNDLQEKHPHTIIISHHLGKKGHASNSVSWIRGSSALLVRVDAAYGFERLSSESEANLIVHPFPKRVRTVPGFQVRLETTENDGSLETAALTWVRDWDTNLDPDLLEKRSLVLDLLEERREEGGTVNDIMSATTGYLSNRQVRDILDSLTHESLAEQGKEAHGRFRFWAKGARESPEVESVAVADDEVVQTDVEETLTPTPEGVDRYEGPPKQDRLFNGA